MTEYHVSAYVEGKSRRVLYDRVKAKSGKEAIAKVKAKDAKYTKGSTRKYLKQENAHGWKATLSTDERQKRRGSSVTGFNSLW